jgi:hypothetical protein
MQVPQGKDPSGLSLGLWVSGSLVSLCVGERESWPSGGRGTHGHGQRKGFKSRSLKLTPAAALPVLRAPHRHFALALAVAVALAARSNKPKDPLKGSLRWTKRKHAT